MNEVKIPSNLMKIFEFKGNKLIEYPNENFDWKVESKIDHSNLINALHWFTYRDFYKTQSGMVFSGRRYKFFSNCKSFLRFKYEKDLIEELGGKFYSFKTPYKTGLKIKN